MNPSLIDKIEVMFPASQCKVVLTLLETECGVLLPDVRSLGIDGIERVRCAVVKVSCGSVDRLNALVQSAKSDWRDVLVAADFANDPSSHRAWLVGKGP